MTKRICYIHVGPHKTGTTSIQWFLQENAAELLAHGYFVPESETKRGAHHALAEGLAGLDVGEHREPLVTRSIAAITDTPAKAIIISSEAVEDYLEIDSTPKRSSTELQNSTSNQSSSCFRATSRNGLTRAMRFRSRASADLTHSNPLR